MPAKNVEIRPVATTDLGVILSLNEQFVHFLSPLDETELKQLVSSADYCRVAVVEGMVAGFLIGFLPGRPYESVNYAWFSQRYRDFAYVDRVVVSPQARGRSIGGLLYDNFKAFAEQQKKRCLVCEYNTIPMNEVSARFHTRYGFIEVGRQTLGPEKAVSMQCYAFEDS